MNCIECRSNLVSIFCGKVKGKKKETSYTCNNCNIHFDKSGVLFRRKNRKWVVQK